ncbi:hypothetical protein A2715_00275 [Candidatus Woesebacteria bacterium RIFCSPHIGHO2_01_FULL_39_32]|uniref:Uncharacterized protein n=2 Tax=Candidatus Woeseibacteriota TaxID=1752722 RepID=A0A0G0SYF6_9BACT|nr:MAG: hypothetical protein UT61_C0004G0034 [Candidatus Woesebacteria bacterium GW2011_GWA1_39_8]OGM03796.1 MAG: hypothetical protein A2124_00395 [Candidatus Woesebacteria bacterium GWB1_37_5]OGM24261.1 MAG: hypothetical protein A2715_00275 [Candidatus Woesebacteria bacterium RIFCSPHIGHO2_01_FULL_39_32]OGM35388.1 MAG: hypothetical protein A3F01_04630 [Candidatus Woesebacteria bacterium RIFCSPHIGHO2_12_FULL_38_11]OGM65332.1 MAG: hypothetical protein A2893_01230 [Candidatus Woesebacteria bacteri
MTELEDGFARQLEVDQQRALELIKPESTAATIITGLYPLLRGRLYPEGKSGEISLAVRRLH